jgi:RecB family exonuclease
LSDLSAVETEDLAGRSVRTAIDELARRRSVLGRERFRRLEERRLTRLLVEWLNLERQRAPFTVVASEGRETAEIGGVRFDLRPDRVDRLEDGSIVLIDYKTGDASPARWSGDRPDEPQRPLSAVAHAANARVGGVYYGILRPGRTGFRGIADSTDIAPGTAVADEPMEAIVEHWGRQVERLGRAFARAEARVDPKSAETCRHCALPGLCRVTDAHRMRGDGPHAAAAS